MSRAATGRPLIQMAGKFFGRWVVLRRSDRAQRGKTFWTCMCTCGATSDVSGAMLRRGESLQCDGCRRAAQRGPASRAQGAVSGRCSWCGEPARKQNPYECDRHNRRAARNGRDAEGRPIGRDYSKRRVLA